MDIRLLVVLGIFNFLSPTQSTYNISELAMELDNDGEDTHSLDPEEIQDLMSLDLDISSPTTTSTSLISIIASLEGKEEAPPPNDSPPIPASESPPITISESPQIEQPNVNTTATELVVDETLETEAETTMVHETTEESNQPPRYPSPLKEPPVLDPIPPQFYSSRRYNLFLPHGTMYKQNFVLDAPPPAKLPPIQTLLPKGKDTFFPLLLPYKHGHVYRPLQTYGILRSVPQRLLDPVQQSLNSSRDFMSRFRRFQANENFFEKSYQPHQNVQNPYSMSPLTSYRPGPYEPWTPNNYFSTDMRRPYNYQNPYNLYSQPAQFGPFSPVDKMSKFSYYPTPTQNYDQYPPSFYNRKDGHFFVFPMGFSGGSLNTYRGQIPASVSRMSVPATGLRMPSYRDNVLGKAGPPRRVPKDSQIRMDSGNLVELTRRRRNSDHKGLGLDLGLVQLLAKRRTLGKRTGKLRGFHPRRTTEPTGEKQPIREQEKQPIREREEQHSEVKLDDLLVKVDQLLSHINQSMQDQVPEDMESSLESEKSTRSPTLSEMKGQRSPVNMTTQFPGVDQLQRLLSQSQGPNSQNKHPILRVAKRQKFLFCRRLGDQCRFIHSQRSTATTEGCLTTMKQLAIWNLKTILTYCNGTYSEVNKFYDRAIAKIPPTKAPTTTHRPLPPPPLFPADDAQLNNQANLPYQTNFQSQELPQIRIMLKPMTFGQGQPRSTGGQQTSASLGQPYYRTDYSSD